MNHEVRDEVMRDTLAHTKRVGDLLGQVISGLYQRAIHHDDSKFSPQEFEAFVRVTPSLKNMTYGSPEYVESLRSIRPALDHHYQNNSHHPQNHTSGIDGMSLLDIIEMLADWKAASERHIDGSLARSITHNAKRFKYGEVLIRLLVITAYQLKWISTTEMISALEQIPLPEQKKSD